MPIHNEILARAVDLRKSYGEHEAVRGVDFEILRGEAFGFLGANGAGKSTTMRMIGCVSQPTSGSLEVFGRDPRTEGAAIRARLGVVPQDNTLDGMLTVFENLVVYAGYFGIKKKDAREKAAELLDFVQLTPRAKDQVSELSGGMQRRLAIARSLINDPDLVILDEPTTGLDPQARHLVWERLFQLKQRGVSILLTTHYMDEAEQLCDRLVVMDEGRIIAAGSPRELIDTHVTKEVVELRFGPAHTTELAELSLTLTGVGAQIESLPDKILVYTDDADDTNAALDARDIRPTSMLARRATLEDVFLRLTGRALVEDET
ncbi:ABC transporter ATP-binding protein [Glycomyces harbinensis]|uniref:Lipooligosaccharide transport system ATP-binding protein n=1 Tax=Glycomyces harbinensis TaxID=58114 RepID=A0A1G7DHM4_9ACTN|nr:ABC transporter ATP-binding protein [Glycomyces harbinensis]SDE50566.1 lipooligosaccharide transport system ATP-binding protein [Glycomyces harbinensis]